MGHWGWKEEEEEGEEEGEDREEEGEEEQEKARAGRSQRRKTGGCILFKECSFPH